MILVFLLACGPSYEEGQAELGRLNCERMEACGTMIAGMDLEECLSIAAAQTYSEDNCPGYRPGPMQDCIAAYETAVKAPDCETDLTAICQLCPGE
ncbi:MAG TPA: hypothetical protein PKY30_06160 [Myxococcota bacterium]|nr:hypothetical protein [Myxococcota bacterium]